jgi:hypothetical protein
LFQQPNVFSEFGKSLKANIRYKEENDWGVAVLTKADLEEQLQAFFEHNPLGDDMVYLKNYIKNHPDNKMGWYLLGKEYAALGKFGKAKYCFAQSGEVYEAFEKKSVRLGFLDEVKANQTMLPGQKGRRRWLFRIIRLAGVLLIAVFLGSFLLEGGNRSSNSGIIPEAADLQASSAAVNTASTSPRIFYSNPLEPKREHELLKGFLLPTEARGSRTLLVEGKLSSDGKWVDGSRLPQLIMSGQTAHGGGGMQVTYHQAEACNCTPVEDRTAVEELGSWVKQMEEEAILQSALRAYISLYGGPLPDSIDGLVRDYPHNLLPGYTERMKAVYSGLKAAQELYQGKKMNPVPAAASGSVTLASSEPGLFGGTLEIIVDKRVHRLALVSGSVILRSFPVGLGGSKTPEGTFFISDKVKNPNGRSDGDFGSRGMQLSDTDYAIHGTNEPRSIGEDRSLGCIRMLKEDIEELFDMAPSGTKVTIGNGLLPADTLRKEEKFRMPSMREEKNPKKVYRWLN